MHVAPMQSDEIAYCSAGRRHEKPWRSCPSGGGDHWHLDILGVAAPWPISDCTRPLPLLLFQSARAIAAVNLLVVRTFPD